jgi:hypothetical protein
MISEVNPEAATAGVDLQGFCSTDSGRQNLQKPFSRGEFTWATNGHVLIRWCAPTG